MLDNVNPFRVFPLVFNQLSSNLSFCLALCTCTDHDHESDIHAPRGSRCVAPKRCQSAPYHPTGWGGVGWCGVWCVVCGVVVVVVFVVFFDQCAWPRTLSLLQLILGVIRPPTLYLCTVSPRPCPGDKGRPCTGPKTTPGPVPVHRALKSPTRVLMSVNLRVLAQQHGELQVVIANSAISATFQGTSQVQLELARPGSAAENSEK